MTVPPPKPVLLDNLLDLLLDAVCVVDADSRFVYVSAAFERIFGYRPDEVVGTPVLNLVHPDDRQATLRVIADMMRGQPHPHFANRYLHKSGHVVHVVWSAHWSAADGVRIAVAHDVTEVKYAQNMQSALHAIAEAAHAAADLMALFKRIHTIIASLLPAQNFFVALYDAIQDELSFPYFVDQYDAPPAPRPLDSGTFTAAVVRGGQPILFCRGARDLPPGVGGSIAGYPSMDWLGVPLTTSSGTIGALVVQSYSDDVRYDEKHKALLGFVSTQVATAIERKRTQTWLQYLAGHDQLTGLANRELLHRQLEEALCRVRAERGMLATLYIDLDKFKQINDDHGHDIGDQLLQEVAHRIRGCVRTGDTVARLGGDEFVVLLDAIADADVAHRAAEAIRAALDAPYELGSSRVRMSSSIGIAVAPAHGDDHRHLMRRADSAMYEVKRRGGNRVHMADIDTADLGPCDPSPVRHCTPDTPTGDRP